MRNYDPDYAAELVKEVLGDFWCVEFQFATPASITTLDVPVQANGRTYEPQDFNFDSIALAAAFSVDKVTIELDNAGLKWSSLFLNDDVRNKTVVVSHGVRLAGPPRSVVVQPIFTGFVDGWEIAGDRAARITIVNELVLWSRETMRLSGSSCPWAFKGEECGYAGGGDWCDQSYERCVALGNTISFEGNRFINSLLEKKIWWGRSQSI